MTNFNIIITNNNKYRININPLACNLCFELVLVLCLFAASYFTLLLPTPIFPSLSLSLPLSLSFLLCLSRESLFFVRARDTIPTEQQHRETSIQSIIDEIANNDDEYNDNDDVDDVDYGVIEIVLH